MIELVSSHSPNAESLILEHIQTYAPSLALASLSLQDSPKNHPSTLCNEHLQAWWTLSVTHPIPDSLYESVYWSLLHLIQNTPPALLLGDSFLRHKLEHYAQYLLHKTPLLLRAQSIRP